MDCLLFKSSQSAEFRFFVRFGAYGEETFEVANVKSEVKGTCRNGVQQTP